MYYKIKRSTSLSSETPFDFVFRDLLTSMEQHWVCTCTRNEKVRKDSKE